MFAAATAPSWRFRIEAFWVSRHLFANGFPGQSAPVPAVKRRGEHMVIGRAGNLPDPRQPHDLRQQSIARHLRPQHQKRRHASGEHIMMLHVKAARGRIEIEPPSVACIRIQVIESDRKACIAGITREVLDFDVTHWALGVVEDQRFRIIRRALRIVPDRNFAIAHLAAGQNCMPPTTAAAPYRESSPRNCGIPGAKSADVHHLITAPPTKVVQRKTRN